MDFFAAVDGVFPPGLCPGGCPLAATCGAVPGRSSALSCLLLLELNGVVAVADVGLLGGQCWKETQSSRGSSAEPPSPPGSCPTP